MRSEKKNNLELFHRLLCASDPLICTFRKKIHKKKSLPPDVIELLQGPMTIIYVKYKFKIIFLSLILLGDNGVFK